MQRLPCLLSSAAFRHQRDTLSSFQLIYSGSRSSIASTSRVQLRPQSSIAIQVPELLAEKKEEIEAPSRWHIEDDRRRAKRASELDSFFSSKQPIAPTYPSADNEALLEHCNRAIVLSRTSSNIRTFRNARAQLQKAAQLFDQIVQAHRDYGVEPDMAYEVFLLRSSWLQVVRTILALVRGNAVQICSRIMSDYLRWEHALLRSGLRIKDGTEKMAAIPDVEVASPKALEIMMERYFHGPFVQDAAPVLHELFSSMTLANDDTIERATRAHKPYRVERRYRRNCRLVGVDLWENISKIGAIHWRKPLSPEWLRICDRTEYKSGQELIASCMLMHAQGLYGDKNVRSIVRIDQSLSVWHGSLSLCEQGCEYYLRKLMTLILKAIRQAGLALSVAGEEEMNRTLDYFSALQGLAKVLNDTFLQVKDDGQSIRKGDLETAFRLILASQGILRKRANTLDVKTRDAVQESLFNTSKMSNAWILKWLNDAKSQKMPRFASITTYNRILERMLQMPLPSAAVNSMTMRLLQRIASDSALPSPDENTISVVIRLAKQSGLEEMSKTAMLLLHCRSQARDISVPQTHRITTPSSEPFGDEERPPPMLKPILSLMDDAIQSADVYRLQTLIANATNRQLSTQGNVESATFSSIQGSASIEDIVFHLYPSLNIRIHRRRGATSRGDHSKDRKRPESHSSIAFHPKILAAAFHQVVAAGRTGLGERVWRMIKRTHKRATKKSKEQKIHISISKS